jgi:hypothetical protein
MSYPPKLHVVTAVFNPRRFRSRVTLYRQFAKRVEDAGAVLHTVELALGERPYEVTEAGNPNHIQLRSADEFFVKENLINIAILKLPTDIKYVAWVDADVNFLHPGWAGETVEMLQHHPVVQMFSVVINLNPDYEAFSRWYSFGYSHATGRPFRPVGKDYNYWHPGFAWAARREFFDATGGLMDRIILGGGDAHMAASLVGKAAETLKVSHFSPQYCEYVLDWERKARKFLEYYNRDVGYVPGLIGHYWHGKFRDRQYVTRRAILERFKFDPYADLRVAPDGLYKLALRDPEFRSALQKYLNSRNEDSIDFDSRETSFR